MCHKHHHHHHHSHHSHHHHGYHYVTGVSLLLHQPMSLLVGAGSFDPYEWRAFYFDKMSRDEANRLLSEDGVAIGTFLLRDSRRPGEMSLSVRESDDDNKIRHYLIEKRVNSDGQENVKIAELYFVDIPMLLNHFKMRVLDKTSLTLPYRKREIERVIALYKFEGDKEADLAFEAGEELEIIGKPEEGWWQARNALNSTGLIPANYVEPIDSDASRGPSTLSSLSNESGGKEKDRLSGMSSQSNGESERDEKERIGQPSLPAMAVVVSDRFPSAYDSSALKLKKGQRINVTRRLHNGFYEGILEGKHGTFPHTYIKWVHE